MMCWFEKTILKLFIKHSYRQSSLYVWGIEYANAIFAFYYFVNCSETATVVAIRKDNHFTYFQKYEYIRHLYNSLNYFIVSKGVSFWKLHVDYKTDNNSICIKCLHNIETSSFSSSSALKTWNWETWGSCFG